LTQVAHGTLGQVLSGPTAAKIFDRDEWHVWWEVKFPTVNGWIAGEYLDAGAPFIVFQDDMESGSGNGFAEPPWGITTVTSPSGTHSWTDSPSGNYANNANRSLWSPFLNFSSVNSATLTFWHRYDLENGFDFGNMGNDG
jgi:hypothetical protein